MLSLRELSELLQCSITTIRNRINDTTGVRKLFERKGFKTQKNVTRYNFYIKEENIEKYKELIKKRKEKKKEKISQTVLDCYNARFNCKYCINNRYCPPDKPLQLLVLDLMDKGVLKQWY